MSELRKLPMSDEEIAVSYRQAAHPASQIQILADLNNVGPSEMRKRLRALGFDIPDAKRAKTAKIDLAAFMAAYREGLTDYELMARFSVSQKVVQSLRDKEKLPPNVKNGERCVASQICTVADLLSALNSVAEMAPEAKVFLEGGSPVSVKMAGLWTGTSMSVEVSLGAV